MRRQDGFTLVEALMAGALSTVLGGAILTVLYLCNDMMEESLAKAKLAAQFEVVAETIHRMAREAYTVSGNGENFSDPSTPLKFWNLGWINFYRRDSTLIGGIGMNSPDPYLWERAGTDMRRFYIAGNPISVHYFHATILEGRTAATFRITLELTQGGKTYTLTSPREMALCRNNLP
ncbi:MAG TPA: prepilin-type N-terminal cleavage/methylation domain-containing protein [Fibrobacteria bacterium]|nr:prepilin-type N-terminal cleavage/methylation domain-containing protein [Fibrobacteria bacterium]